MLTARRRVGDPRARPRARPRDASRVRLVREAARCTCAKGRKGWPVASMARGWRGNGEGKRGSEAAAGGLDPATSRIPTHLRATALYCEACPCVPNPCYINYEYFEVRVLRVVSITSKNGGNGGHGGRLRSRDLQQTSPCAPESCLAAPRSAPFFLKSLLYEWLALRGRRAEDTREKTAKTARVSTDAARRTTTQQPQPLSWTGPKKQGVTAPPSI